MFAVLGDIPFQVVGSPEAFSDSRRYDYAEHRVVQARPVLQWLADDLVTIRLEMLLHRSFTEPLTSLLVLQQTASTHAALPLVFGNGDFRGYFVIEEIDTVSRQLSGIGDIFEIVVRLRLRESPVQFDPSAPPIPSFLPLGIAAASSSAASTLPVVASAGVSALAALISPSGPPSSILVPDDVPASLIVRSAQ
jgi:phage protein U